MSYKIEELNPSNPFIEINGRKIKLTLLTLQKDVYFTDNHESFNKLVNQLGENPTNILIIIYVFLADKGEFNNSINDFKNFIFSGNIVEVTKQMTRVLFNEIIPRSMPLIRNIKRYKEIQQINQDASNVKPCYAVYYDLIAKRYGYTITEFCNLTLRQLHILLQTIGDESHKELEMQAALNGRQLKEKIKYEDISIEDEQEQDEMATDMLKRLQDEYNKNQGK